MKKATCMQNEYRNPLGTHFSPPTLHKFSSTSCKGTRRIKLVRCHGWLEIQCARANLFPTKWFFQLNVFHTCVPKDNFVEKYWWSSSTTCIHLKHPLVMVPCCVVMRHCSDNFSQAFKKNLEKIGKLLKLNQCSTIFENPRPDEWAYPCRSKNFIRVP